MTTVTPVLTVVAPERPDAELSTDELGSRIVGMAGRLAAATCHWLLLVAEFDRREGCASFGVWTTAQWLSHHCGIAHRTALEHVRVARALLAFPQLATEMSAGRLSYSQVRAISRVPHDGEQRLVDDLVRIARHGSAAQLESMLRGVRTADEADHPKDQPREYLRSAWTTTQQRNIIARLDPERGALVDKAITELARREQIPVVDAFVRMAEITLATLAAGDTSTRTLRGDELAAIVVHVTAQVSDNVPPRSAERTPPARLQDGPALPRSVVERLACAGRVRTVVHDCDGTPLDVGRSHRLVTAKLFRALLERDRGCTHPGCGSRRFLHAHHVRSWMHGGNTDLHNLLLLCGAHHRALHDGAFSLQPAGRGRWRFLRADGHELLASVHPERYADRTGAVDAEHPTAPDAPTTRWTGERVSRHFAVGVIADRRVASARGGAGRPPRAFPDHDPWAATPA